MPAIVTHIDFAMLLDVLAIGCSLVMILFLLVNRRRYGRLVLDRQGPRGQAGFADQLSLQMMSQQSQKAYANLQQTLAREFESLRLLGANVPCEQTHADPVQAEMAGPDRRHDHRQRYRMAREMIARGDTTPQITLQCGLTEGELELLQGLQQLEGSEAAQTKPPVGATP